MRNTNVAFPVSHHTWTTDNVTRVLPGLCGQRTRPYVLMVADGSGACVSQVHIQHSHRAENLTALCASFCWQALKNANLIFHQHLTPGQTAKGTKSRFDDCSVTVPDWPPDLDQWCQEEDEQRRWCSLAFHHSWAVPPPHRCSHSYRRPNQESDASMNWTHLTEDPTILLKIFVLNLCITPIVSSHL